MGELAFNAMIHADGLWGWKILLILAILLTLPAPHISAAPVAPSLSITITPLEAVPGQAGFVYVSGGYPLEVAVYLDESQLTVYWTGDSYLSPFSFGHDEVPGQHGIVVTARNPLTGELLTRSETITVTGAGYLLEELNVSSRLSHLLDPALNQAEYARIAQVVTPRTPQFYFDWPFVLPAAEGPITSQYGAYRVYNGGVLSSYHSGTDFRRFNGDPVYAAAGGRVSAVEIFQVYGNVVIIDHGFGVYTFYAHLSETYVQPGQEVLRGQLIAAAGSTGRSTGPHLHFEVIVNGYSVDAMRWMALVPGFVPPPEVPYIPPPEETPEEAVGS
jgi:hypothetical protein